MVSGFDLMFRHTLELSPLESENKKKKLRMYKCFNRIIRLSGVRNIVKVMKPVSLFK